MPNVPKPKPKNYSKILDILNTPAAAKQFSPKTYVNLVGEYSRKAYDNGELSKKEYMDIVQPLFGDAGIMATEKIKQYENELNKYANGGRINFRGGDAARSDAASGRSAGRSSPSGGPDDRSTAAQTAAHNAAVAAAQAANTVEEKMNILDTLNRFRPNTFVNPYNYSVNLNKNIGPFGLNVGINTLGMLGIDDPRTPEDESEQSDYGINAGYNTDLFGGNLSLGAGYNPMSGANFGLSFSKQFNQGGRVGFADGPKDPTKRKFIKAAAGIASIPILGRFIKPATKAIEAAAPAIQKSVEGIPDFLTDLIAKIKLKAEATGMKYFTGNRSDEFTDVYQADNFIVKEKGNKITLREVDDPDRPGYRENEIELEVDPETGGVTYKEASVRPDDEGKLKDVEEFIDEEDLENMRKYTYDE